MKRERTWDQPDQRETVRRNCRRVLDCRTLALGGEVYASSLDEKTFYHTCKSRCCPRCENRGTLLWQREQWSSLPDIDYVGVVLIMPDVFGPIFKANRRFQYDLPSLGASVIQQGVWTRYRVRISVIVIQHTFGGRLNYYPHLHLMVTSEGMNTVEVGWTDGIDLDRNEIMELWRYAVVLYVRRAYRERLFSFQASNRDFETLMDEQLGPWWNIHISPKMSKTLFIRYAGRYIYRLPISNRRLLSVNEEQVVYEWKNTKMKCYLQISCSPEEFVSILAEHVLDHYRHSMRYFGLLSPRTKRQTSASIDASGQRMRWVRSVRPI